MTDMGMTPEEAETWLLEEMTQRDMYDTEFKLPDLRSATPDEIDKARKFELVGGVGGFSEGFARLIDNSLQ